ncbi:hypothetical protein O3G_MSEX007782 [Manduca sexta]|uniref:Beta-glucuronidase n=1 Tax=Manduca sexta TaxID=7130 RepID=A0A921Z8L6_MANSE|nr:hypothetical protein O3G_MSEX007782 [Manduca sexta]KAG6452780.1 hypothetical protein O3G_MSEX007782 [Manduca sexta]KAG6452781.1 hypothetical protein O3G_MSEX007782 [Manduca sexta]KAG6452782.1 hypothetical protein O3G_MSEX007782 [Manduca sexta]KAG6452783.1 hypothetical protein O3G_MSEX007782 [Manduca sexta]
MHLVNVKVLFIIMCINNCHADAKILKSEADKPSKPIELNVNAEGSLYPRETETREVKTLDGIWKFRVLPPVNTGCLGAEGPTILMPVPSSYNDVTQNVLIRDHVGLVCYERQFRVPSSWSLSDRRVWLRFSSVSYAANVSLNGYQVGSHKIGHLPFDIDITGVFRHNANNFLTVAVDNTLGNNTIPQGIVEYIRNANSQVHVKQSYTFDFFNYAGIHRSVFLHSTPKIYVDDIKITTNIQGDYGFVSYETTYKGTTNNVQCLVQIYDKNNDQVAHSKECSGSLLIPKANFWWPYLMDSNPGYLYTFKISLINSRKELIDTYYEKIGIRTIEWTNTSIFINEKPLYLRGFGMHEDSDLRGKGWDPVLWVKNFNLLQWVGANAFRTSHYPYAEEIYQLADELGIMIIGECPSVDTDIFGPELLTNHKLALTKMINRDKNHPSVIIWSIANEPRTQKDPADAYFKQIADHVKSLDTSRPITFSTNQQYYSDKAVKHVDVISVNRYLAWYEEPGQLMDVVANLTHDIAKWHKKFNKPVLISEYGSDAITGFHAYPEYVWSEDYQLALLSEHFKAFDQLRPEGFFVGEFIWNFADFNTPQSFTRAGGNKKGIFTRSRQPKSAAHLVRARYNSIAKSEGYVTQRESGYYIFKDEPIKRVDLY